MREERGQVGGDMVVYEPFTLWGSVGGNVSVIDGGKLYLRGSVYGSVAIEAGGRVHIYGSVQRDVIVHKGAKLIHSGVIAGDLINEGGRAFVEADAKVNGKIKTRSGETKIASKFKSG